ILNGADNKTIRRKKINLKNDDNFHFRWKFIIVFLDQIFQITSSSRIGKNLFNNIFMTHLLFDSQCQQIDQTVSFITQQSGTDNLLFIIQNNLYFSNWFIS